MSDAIHNSCTTATTEVPCINLHTALALPIALSTFTMSEIHICTQIFPDSQFINCDVSNTSCYVEVENGALLHDVM